MGGDIRRVHGLLALGINLSISPIDMIDPAEHGASAAMLSCHALHLQWMVGCDSCKHKIFKGICLGSLGKLCLYLQ